MTYSRHHSGETCVFFFRDLSSFPQRIFFLIYVHMSWWNIYVYFLTSLSTYEGTVGVGWRVKCEVHCGVKMWGDCKVHCGVHCAVKCGVHCGVHYGRKVRYCKIPYNIVGARPAICKSGIKDHAYCGLIQPGIWRTILEGLRILQQTKARCSEWKAGDSQKTPHGVVSGNADTPRTGNCASHNQPPSFFFGKSTSNSPGKRLDEESMGHGVNAIKENVPGALWNMMNIMILLTCDKPVNSHFVLWKWTHADMQEKYNYNHNKIALI